MNTKTLSDTLQSDTSPGCFLTDEHTYEAAVKAPSQSALIDYTHRPSIQILQRKSNHRIVYSNTTKKVCSYPNISPPSLTESCGPRMSIEQNKC